MILQLKNGEIYYDTAGSGEAVILMHGNFNDHQIWNEQLPALAEHYQVIRYDLRGYGRSSTPEAAFSNVADLKALIDELALAQVHLVGSSSGGGAAIDFALEFPQLVRSLTLVAPSVNGNRYPWRMTWQAIKNYNAVKRKGREQAIEAFISNPFWQYFFPAESKSKGAARMKVLHNVRNSSNFYRFPPALSAAVKPYAFNRLREIKVPALIIVSDQDHPFNLKTAETLHANIENCSKIVMPGCSHLPFVEEPAAFNQMVLDFLSQQRLR